MRLIVLLVMIASGVAGLRGLETLAAPTGDELAAKVHIQLGHPGEVFSVAFSPDGKLALSGGFDKTLKLWEIATGRELRSFGR
jgi:WD40 repeat protein